jgi:hypothetical protein
MSALRLQVLAAEVKTSAAKPGKNPVQYQVLQCCIHGAKLEVGVLRVFGDLAQSVIEPGFYIPEFGLQQGWRDTEKGEVIPSLIALHRDGKAPSQTAPKAAA